MKQTSGRPSKTVPWVKKGYLSIPIMPEQEVFTCTIDKSKRPSAIPTAKEGQKCIVILEEKKMQSQDEELKNTIIEILTSKDPEVQKIVRETLEMSDEEMIEFLHSGKSSKPLKIEFYSQEPLHIELPTNHEDWKNKCTQDLIEAINARYPPSEQPDNHNNE